jgi:hypothetical protein
MAAGPPRHSQLHEHLSKTGNTGKYSGRLRISPSLLTSTGGLPLTVRLLGTERALEQCFDPGDEAVAAAGATGVGPCTDSLDHFRVLCLPPPMRPVAHGASLGKSLIEQNMMRYPRHNDSHDSTHTQKHTPGDSSGQGNSVVCLNSRP